MRSTTSQFRILKIWIFFSFLATIVIGCHSANNTTPFEKDSFDQNQDDQRKNQKPEVVTGPMDRMTWYLQEWQQVARAYNFGKNIKSSTETQGCVTYIPRAENSMEIRLNHCRATDSENRIFVISGSQYVKRDESGAIILTTSSSFELTNRSQLFLYWPQNGVREPYKLIRHIVIKPLVPSSDQRSTLDYQIYSELISNKALASNSDSNTDQADQTDQADRKNAESDKFTPNAIEPKKNDEEHWVLEAADSLILEGESIFKIRNQSQLSITAYRSTNRNRRVEGSAHLTALGDISILDSCGKLDGAWGWDVLTKSGASTQGKFLTEVGAGLIMMQESNPGGRDIRSWSPCFGI